MNVIELARPQVRALQAYSSARMEAEASAVMLNANESPWPAEGDDMHLNRYPEPQPPALCRRLAQLYGVGSAQLLAGRGSDEAIDLLVRAFCRPGIDAIAISPPTFGMYAVCAGVQGAAVQRLPLDEDFRLDGDALLEKLLPAVKLLFVCSPNNPTGGLVPLADISRIAEALQHRALVIVDEAYIEFADSDSACTLLDSHANVCVLRTLSKAWALAGARIGTVLAHPDVIELLRKIMPPYPLPTPCVQAALRVLGTSGRERTCDRIAVIVSERDRLSAALAKLPGVRRVFPSRANFLTVRLDDADGVRRRLSAQGVVVRDVGRYPGLDGCLRISIGSEEENAHLLRVLDPLGVTA